MRSVWRFHLQDITVHSFLPDFDLAALLQHEIRAEFEKALITIDEEVLILTNQVRFRPMCRIDIDLLPQLPLLPPCIVSSWVDMSIS